MRIHQIFVSDGHNFFGHHGSPAGSHRATELDEVQCVAGRGLRGDRFFDHKRDYKGQITFFSLEVLEDLRRKLDLPELSSASVRRNVIVSGIDLNELVGADFEVQGIRFSGVEECKPCYWMNQAVAPGAEELLAGQGGLRCRVLSSGVLRRDPEGEESRSSIRRLHETDRPLPV